MTRPKPADDPRVVQFKDIPIGVEFDIVAPGGQYWGDPFYVKVSETEHRAVGGNEAYVERDVHADQWCWLNEDELRLAVRLAREAAGK